jgi:hypothetical protein
VTDAATFLQQLVGAGAITPQTCGPESRYYGLPLLTQATPDGGLIVYGSRRFIPPRDEFALLQRHRVVAGERVDALAGSILGNPLSYWQICDANVALEPEDVTASPGSFVDITLPAGVPGA